MPFQEVELREEKSPVINQTQFIRTVADNIKKGSFDYGSTKPFLRRHTIKLYKFSPHTHYIGNNKNVFAESMISQFSS